MLLSRFKAPSGEDGSTGREHRLCFRHWEQTHSGAAGDQFLRHRYLPSNTPHGTGTTARHAWHPIPCYN